MITTNNIKEIIGELVMTTDKRFKTAPSIKIIEVRKKDHKVRLILDSNNELIPDIQLYPTDRIEYDILAKKTGKTHLCGFCYVNDLIQIDRDLKIKTLLKN